MPGIGNKLDFIHFIPRAHKLSPNGRDLILNLRLGSLDPIKREGPYLQGRHAERLL
jgi:hypothetical protein